MKSIAAAVIVCMVTACHAPIPAAKKALERTEDVDNFDLKEDSIYR